MSALTLITAFRPAAPYWLWEIQRHADGSLAAQVCRGLTTLCWLRYSAEGDLRIEGQAWRELPDEVLAALDRVQAALPDRRGDVLPTGGGYTRWG